MRVIQPKAGRTDRRRQPSRKIGGEKNYIHAGGLRALCVAMVSGADDHHDSPSAVARRTVTVRVESAWHRSVKDDSASLSTMTSLATPARDARSHSSVSPRLAASLAPRIEAGSRPMRSGPDLDR